MFMLSSRNNFRIISLLIFSVVTISLLGSKSASAKTKNYKQALLGTWVYVKTSRVINTGELNSSVAGFIEFQKNGYAILDKKRISIRRVGARGTVATVARWNVRDLNTVTINRLGEVPSGAHLISVGFEFITQNRPTKKNKKRHAKLLEKPLRSVFLLTNKNTLYSKIRLKLKKEKSNSNSKTRPLQVWNIEESEKLMRLSEFKRLHPNLLLQWNRHLYQELNNAKTASFQHQDLFRCDYWRFHMTDYNQCMVMKNIFYNHYGHDGYKFTDKRPKVTSSRFLLEPINNYSDTKPIPSKICYGLSVGRSRKKILALRDKLKAGGYKDTFWILKIRPNTIFPPKKHKNEFELYLNALIIWSDLLINENKSYSASRKNLVHLRGDGVFGLSWDKSDRIENVRGKPRLVYGGKPRMVYDPRNHWTYDGGNLTLSWQSSTSTYKFDLRKSPGVKGRYEHANISLILNNGRLYYFISALKPNKKTLKEIRTFSETQCGGL